MKSQTCLVAQQTRLKEWAEQIRKELLKAADSTPAFVEKGEKASLSIWHT